MGDVKRWELMWDENGDPEVLEKTDGKLVLFSDHEREVARRDARIAELEAELANWKTPSCWHCHVLLEDEPGRPHCTDCPPDGDCDDCECKEPGCAEDVESFRNAGGDSCTQLDSDEEKKDLELALLGSMCLLHIAEGGQP